MASQGLAILKFIIIIMKHKYMKRKTNSSELGQFLVLYVKILATSALLEGRMCIGAASNLLVF